MKFYSALYITNKAILPAISKPKVIIAPFLTNFKNPYSTPFCFNILNHIIPARAPTGDNIAPILEPIIVAYIKFIFVVFCKIEPKAIVIGILLTKLHEIVDENK